MYFIFSLIALFCWSGSDLFSKTGTSQNDKNSHWHVIFAVGVIMGLHAIISLLLSSVFDFSSSSAIIKSLFFTDFKIIDLLRYFPVAFIYLLAMVIGYIGLRYIELSISSPICNSSGSLALVICLIFGLSKLDGALPIIGVILITIGILFLGIVDYNENEEVKLARQDKQKFKYRKSFIAIVIPVIYLIIDALGTVGDQVISELQLFDISEYASNTAFEFTSLIFAIFAFIFVKAKKEKFFDFGDSNQKVLKRNLIFAGLFETFGQIFYMSVMFSDFDAGMPIISSYCVLSVIWSRIFLKEKLSFKHYIAIILTFIGIILLGIFSPV